jgi:hypothetical protein
MNSLSIPKVTLAVTASSSTVAKTGKGFIRALNCQRGRGSLSSLHPALPAIFVFQNLYNPFSPYLTLAFNICLLIMLLLQNRLRVATVSPLVIATAIVVLIWLCLVSVVRGDVEFQVLFKYLRTTATIVVLALIFGSFKTPERFFIQALNLVFSFHILLIALQVLWPSASIITAPVFGFERDMSILEEYSMRKLGASSSYDTASIFSIAGLLFFMLQFLQVRRPFFMFASIIAFIATLISSRTGMAVALLVVIFFCFRLISTASIGWKFVTIAGGSVVAVVTYSILMPLLLHSLGIAELQSDDVTVVFAAADYGTTGTLEALTHDHLEPLNRPLKELIFGYGLDPNTIGKTTDIGYVKFIYHLGIVGTLIIVSLHIFMLANVYAITKYSKPHTDLRLLANFLLFFILIALVFNYKSLELYSRGTGDFIFLLFLYLTRIRHLQNRHSCLVSETNTNNYERKS